MSQKKLSQAWKTADKSVAWRNSPDIVLRTKSKLTLTGYFKGMYCKIIFFITKDLVNNIKKMENGNDPNSQN